jgi:mono/diheme cytochrome c family protein
MNTAFAPNLLRVTALGLAAIIAQPAPERWCAACHVVSVDQRQASSDAPPFAEIAKRPNFSEAGVTTFLLDPHAKMPNMNLTRFEAGDIAAYIGKLR